MDYISAEDFAQSTDACVCKSIRIETARFVPKNAQNAGHIEWLAITFFEYARRICLLVFAQAGARF